MATQHLGWVQTREQQPQENPKKKYCVGVQENGHVVGYTYGPYDTKAEALDCLGDYHGVIVCFFSDGTEKIIYRWSIQDNNWERA
jgi:hypothetical protein